MVLVAMPINLVASTTNRIKNKITDVKAIATISAAIALPSMLFLYPIKELKNTLS